MLRDDLLHLQTVVSSWPGVTASPHRFGGVEFNLDAAEIGHFHTNGLVDLPFSRKIRDQLTAEGKAEPHHLLRDTGWISFYIRSKADVQAAIDLFRLAYLFYATRGRQRAALGQTLDVKAELDKLRLSDPLRAVFDRATARG